MKNLKTTTRKASEKRLNKLIEETKGSTNAVRRGTIAVNLVERVINGSEIIRPCYASGRGKFTSNQDHTQITENYLSKIGIMFESGNDSPRGGKTGNYIKIITKISQN